MTEEKLSQSIPSPVAEEALESVGPYRIEGLLGAGGMGRVYRAFDQRLDRFVAIKHILPSRANDSRARRRLHHEAKAAARLAHPAIVQIFDILESEGGDWIVMELVEGPTVADLLEDGPLSVSDALRMGREVAAGLECAHSQGIVHRDLKAENVVFPPTGHARILDFGLAKQQVELNDETSLTLDGTVMGTYRSMSPEQAKGHSVGSESDMFSLGVLLYEALTGISPFRGPSPFETMERICNQQPTPLRELNSKVPPDVVWLVDQLLEKLPERRLDAGRAVAELQAIAAGKASSRPSRRHLDVRAETTVADLPPLIGTKPSQPPAGEPPTPAIPRTNSGNFAGLRRIGLPTLGALGAVLVVALSPWVVQPWAGSARDSMPSPATLEGRSGSTYEEYLRGRDLLRYYYRGDNLQQAIELFEAAILVRPDNSLALSGLAQAYWLQDRKTPDGPWLRRALTASERAVETSPHLAAARVSHGTVLAATGLRDEGIAEIEEGIRLDPLSGLAHRRLARAHGAERADEVRQALERSVELDPDDWLTHQRLGHLHFEQGRFAEAETHYLRTIELAPDNSSTHSNLMAVYHLQERFDEAAALLQRSLEIEPRAETYSNLGTLYFSQGRYRQATSAFEQAVQLGPTEPVYWANLGDGRRWVPETRPLAAEAYQRATQLLVAQSPTEPGDAGTLSRLALWHAKLGDSKRALNDLGVLSKLPVDSAWDWYRILVANELLGRRGEALKALEAALQRGLVVGEIERDPELRNLRQDGHYSRITKPYISS